MPTIYYQPTTIFDYLLIISYVSSKSKPKLQTST